MRQVIMGGARSSRREVGPPEPLLGNGVPFLFEIPQSWNETVSRRDGSSGSRVP